MKRSGLICGILEGWESIGLGDCSDKAAEKGKIVVKNDSQTSGLSRQNGSVIYTKGDTWG